MSRQKSAASLTAEDLKRLVHYDPATGAITRLAFTKLTPKTGVSRAKNGGSDSAGYIRLFIAGKLRRVHRLAWLYMTGEWPKHQIDHINGIKSDNRWANLRDVPPMVNNQNRRRPFRNSSSGYLGVHRNAEGKFSAQLSVNGVTKPIGRFTSAEEAHSAYVRAKRQLHEGCTL